MHRIVMCTLCVSNNFNFTRSGMVTETKVAHPFYDSPYRLVQTQFTALVLLYFFLMQRN